MARVPSKFQPEPGESRCGNSFDQAITVTGEIYGRGGFGVERKHILARIVQVPSGNWSSFRSQDEADFVHAVKNHIGYARDQLIEATQSDAITTAQANSIAWLLKLADANLDRVEALYDYWDGKSPHPATGFGLPAWHHDNDWQAADVSEWPLRTGDAIFNHVSQCQGVSDQWVSQRGLVGQNVEHVRWYFCPSEAMRQRRSADRDDIRKLLLDAARAVRCAGWGIWRLTLYRQSIAAWEDKYGGIGFGVAPTPPPVTPTPGLGMGGLGFAADLPDPEPPGHPDPPPWEPSDFKAPDPGDLPPPDEPDAELVPEAADPEGVPIVPTPTTPAGPPVAAAGPLGKIPVPLAVGAGALALWFLTK